MQSTEHLGFTYEVELIDKNTGEVIWQDTAKNLMPYEGLDHMLSVLFGDTTQINNWYIGLYEGAYTPSRTDTAAAFPTAATEVTSYTESTRVVFNNSLSSLGVTNNFANVAEFNFTGSKTIQGGFISSVATKGASSGVLLSAVKFDSPKPVTADSILRVKAGLNIVS